MITWNKELYHSWGKSPKQKAREKEYNHWYYLRNKEKWAVKGAKDRIKDSYPVTVEKVSDKNINSKGDQDDFIRIRRKDGGGGVNIGRYKDKGDKYGEYHVDILSKGKYKSYGVDGDKIAKKISKGKKKYDKYMSIPATKPSAKTKKSIDRRAKNLSKENRVSEAKKYRQTKRILKESGYVPNGNARDRYKMDRENQSRINTAHPGAKINMYSSADDWDERLKKKKKKR